MYIIPYITSRILKSMDQRDNPTNQPNYTLPYCTATIIQTGQEIIKQHICNPSKKDTGKAMSDTSDDMDKIKCISAKIDDTDHKKLRYIDPEQLNKEYAVPNTSNLREPIEEFDKSEKPDAALWLLEISLHELTNIAKNIVILYKEYLVDKPSILMQDVQYLDKQCCALLLKLTDNLDNFCEVLRNFPSEHYEIMSMLIMMDNLLQNFNKSAISENKSETSELCAVQQNYSNKFITIYKIHLMLHMIDALIADIKLRLSSCTLSIASTYKNNISNTIMIINDYYTSIQYNYSDLENTFRVMRTAFLLSLTSNKDAINRRLLNMLGDNFDIFMEILVDIGILQPK